MSNHFVRRDFLKTGSLRLPAAGYLAGDSLFAGNALSDDTIYFFDCYAKIGSNNSSKISSLIRFTCLHSFH